MIKFTLSEPAEVFVEMNDSDVEIVTSNGTTTRALQSLNGLANANVIYAGQTLRIK